MFLLPGAKDLGGHLLWTLYAVCVLSRLQTSSQGLAQLVGRMQKLGFGVEQTSSRAFAGGQMPAYSSQTLI